jgi:pimeloyl-ACP methyl ester carboxylesterase
MPVALCNGINIDYRVEGRGDPLVLIMGFTGGRNLWMFQVPAFKKHYQVVTFDNRGVGKSDKPRGPYSARMMAEDTIALMDHVGIKKAHVLGFSMGGMIAQELAINYPERVAKLVLAATYACSDDGPNGGTPELVEAQKLPIKDYAIRLANLVSVSPLRLVFGTLQKLQLRFMDDSGCTGLSGQKEACLDYDAADRLRSIQSSTLVMVGTGDRVLKPSSSEMLAERIPGAKLIRFENGSHMLCTDFIRRFNAEVLDFLATG